MGSKPYYPSWMSIYYRLRWVALLLCFAAAYFAWQGAFEPVAGPPKTPGGVVPIPFQSDARTLATLAGFFFGVFAFLQNAKDRLDQTRDHHTLELLVETRLSSEFRRQLDNRRRYFREGQEIDPELYWEYLNAPNADDENHEDHRKRECAEAIRTLLNHYEFLALGLYRGDLDHGMLKGAIRGIMCNLVKDARHVVDSYRENSPKTYINLARLYNRWKDDDFPSLANVPPLRPLERTRRRIARMIEPG